jgi:hypothetical protein
MYIDIYDNIRNLAIEMDGRHHYDATAFSNGQIRLEKQQSRDTLKDKLLKEHDIKIIHITGNYSIKSLIDILLSSPYYSSLKCLRQLKCDIRLYITPLS